MRYCILLILLVIAPTTFAKTDLSPAIYDGIKDQHQLRPTRKPAKTTVKAPHMAVKLKAAAKHAPRHKLVNRWAVYPPARLTHDQVAAKPKAIAKAHKAPVKKLALKKEKRNFALNKAKAKRKIASGKSKAKYKSRVKIEKKQKIAAR